MNSKKNLPNERSCSRDTPYEYDWRWIVFIDLPAGQVCWHIHDSELPLFMHLPRNTGRKWDGHDHEEKYRRVGALNRGER